MRKMKKGLAIAAGILAIFAVLGAVGSLISNISLYSRAGVMLPVAEKIRIYALGVVNIVLPVLLAVCCFRRKLGIFPGIVMGLGLIAVVEWRAHKDHLVPAHGWSGFPAVWKTFRSAFWGFLMPVIILGGIYGGVFTPTEAAAVAAVYGLFVGVFIYRNLKWKDLVDIFADTARSTGGLMLIVGAATIFSYACTKYGISSAVQGILESGNKFTFLLIANIVFLIAGCFVDANSAMYIFIPIMYPVAKTLGVDLIHFGMVATVNLAIGQFTPPVGMNLFVASGMKLKGYEVSVEELSKAVIPMILAGVVVLMLITYVPWFTLFLIR